MIYYVINGKKVAAVKDDPTIIIAVQNKKLDIIVLAVAKAFEMLGVEGLPVITSGKEKIKTRLTNSMHYVDSAFDFSIKGLTKDQLKKLRSTVLTCLSTLDNHFVYDVVDHGGIDHLHVEYDIRKAANFEKKNLIPAALLIELEERAKEVIKEAQETIDYAKAQVTNHNKNNFIQFACSALTGLLACNGSDGEFGGRSRNIRSNEALIGQAFHIASDANRELQEIEENL